MADRARLRCLVLAGALLLTGCGPRGAGTAAGEAAPLVVFAAASLAEAFAELGDAFEQRHGGAVVLNLAGSQQLAQQLRLGAPADVFASADTAQMQRAVASGRVAAGTPRPFARNRLVVVVPRGNPASLTRLQELAQPGLRLVLAAEDVPAGRYARRFLDLASREDAFAADYGAQVLARVASFETNVRAVLTKVALGEADAGIVYASDAAKASVGRLGIPDALNVEAVYPVAPIADSEQPARAKAFVAFVLAAEGQHILARHGFETAAR